MSAWVNLWIEVRGAGTWHKALHTDFMPTPDARVEFLYDRSNREWYGGGKVGRVWWEGDGSANVELVGLEVVREIDRPEGEWAFWLSVDGDITEILRESGWCKQ